VNLYFIGITPVQSAITQILPLWSKILGVNLDLICINLSIDASAHEYRQIVSQIKDDTHALGSVVTNHKTRLFEYASDLFDEVDELAQLTKEISTIAKQGSFIAGSSGADCLSTTYSIKNMLGQNYWQNNISDVVCFGAGGVARSIALSLIYDFESSSPLTTKQSYMPRRLFLVDIDQQQLRAIESLLEKKNGNIETKYFYHSAASDNDELLSKLAVGSLIINASGLGKDQPGSPLTDQAIFPVESVIWELNYRGERHFLKQARSQEIQQKLHIHDGWLCFLYGWTQALQLMLRQRFSVQQFQQLASVASPFHINRVS
jgi:shikimate dehydrogenase